MSDRQPIDSAPRDGTMLWLLVDYSEGGAPLADATTAWTIGFNNYDNTGEDIWQFAGWCWSHDCFTEGSGKPIAYKYIGFELEADGLDYQVAEKREPTPPKATGPLSLYEQLAHLRTKYPDATLSEPRDNQDRLLTVPGVRLPNGWFPETTTFYVVIPYGYPHMSPMRFYTAPDVALEHGFRSYCSEIEHNFWNVGSVVHYLWQVTEWDPNHCNLYAYIGAMLLYFYSVSE